MFSLFEQGQKENLEESQHDAVCNSLAAHSLLKRLLEKNSYSNIADLVDKFPQCLIDMELFLALEVEWNERKTSDEELKSFEIPLLHVRRNFIAHTSAEKKNASGIVCR